MTRESDGTHLFHQANQLYGEGRYDLALDLYFKAMERLPDSAEVKNNLAVLLKQLGETALAEQCLHEALSLRPDYADALNNLGNLYRETGRIQLAARCFHQALQLAPGNPVLWNNLGFACKMANQFDDAITCLTQARTLPECPAEASFTLAIALLQTGHHRAGWELYQQRWSLPELAKRRALRDALAPEWQGENLAGKTLLVWAEQGLGDTLQMVRFLPALAAQWPTATLLLAVDAPLQELLAGQHPAITVCGLETQPSADFHLPIMTLPWLWLEHGWTPVPPAPYLTAPSARTATGKPAKPRIGIVWESGNGGVSIVPDREQASRSLPVAVLSRLLDFPRVEWVSLQYQGSATLAGIPITITDPTATIRSLADSARLIQDLDMVVSVDTVVAHLAAAMGKPVLTMMRFAGGNLFPASGESFPWYPTMTVLRQETAGEWLPVIEQVHQRISAMHNDAPGHV